MKNEHNFNPDEHVLAHGDHLLPENFPELGNLSAGFMYKFIPRPKRKRPTEFAYIPLRPSHRLGDNYDTKASLTIAQWNATWEAGHLRSEFVPQTMRDSFPSELDWLKETSEVNLYLIPNGQKSKYEAFIPLYHLLPLRTLRKFGLPSFKRGLWPPWMQDYWRHSYMKGDFDERVARAFAAHIWPLIDSGSRIKSFSKDCPIVILAHNLNFWIPFSVAVTESRLREFGRVKIENKKQDLELRKLRKKLPDDILADRPKYGGTIWKGEDDAWEITKQVVDLADRQGKLRTIIDAIRSNRVGDDFSSLWSYAKEDFERKLYHKRAKVRVTFVELDDSIPVHAPTSELHENLLWEDFLALLDPKERHIVVCLKNGITKLVEIAKKLGYANHSPVSKALSRIREKAKQYLSN